MAQINKLLRRTNGKLPTQDRIKAVLFYDPETGIFLWRHRQDVLENWNTRWAGKPAGTWGESGYLSICIDYVPYRANRLAWIYVHGDVLPPDMWVDHKDVDSSNNRIRNLRPATNSQNMGNSRGWSERDLPKGVIKDRKRFVAQIMVEGVMHRLGRFDSPDEAQAAYAAGARRLRGEFARAA